MGYEAGSSTNAHALLIYYQNHRTTGGGGRITSTALVPQGGALSFLPVLSHVQAPMHDVLTGSRGGRSRTTWTGPPEPQGPHGGGWGGGDSHNNTNHRVHRGGGGPYHGMGGVATLDHIWGPLFVETSRIMIRAHSDLLGSLCILTCTPSNVNFGNPSIRGHQSQELGKCYGQKQGYPVLCIAMSAVCLCD